MINIELFNQFINLFFNKNDAITHQSSSIGDPSKITAHAHQSSSIGDPSKITAHTNQSFGIGDPSKIAAHANQSFGSCNEINFSIPIPIDFPVPSYIDQSFHSPNFNFIYHYRFINSLSNSPYLSNEHSNNNSKNISPCLYSTLLIDSI